MIRQHLALILTATLISPLVHAIAAQSQTPEPQTLQGAPEQADDYVAANHEHHWYKSVEASLIEEKFDDLDAMANTYRRDKTRLPGGEWRLRLFYKALDTPQLTDKDSV